MLNAVDEWVDHYSYDDPDKRAQFATFGKGAKIKELAYAHLSEYDLPPMEGIASSKSYYVAPQQSIQNLINRPLND